MNLKACVLLSAFALAGCAPQPKPSPQWTVDGIVGLRLELAYPTRPNDIWDMRFGRESVAVTLGKKKSGDDLGWTTSPLSSWKLVDGRLQIGEAEQLTLVSRDASTLVVRSGSGKLATFKILEARK